MLLAPRPWEPWAFTLNFSSSELSHPPIIEGLLSIQLSKPIFLLTALGLKSIFGVIVSVSTPINPNAFNLLEEVMKREGRLV